MPIYFANGRPVPFSTRRLLADLADRGQGFIAGLEVEFHLFRLEDPRLAPVDATQPATAPEVSLLAHGFNYLTETRFDELEPALEILRRQWLDMDLPALPNLLASGWHLHQSLIDARTNDNLFMPPVDDAALSPVGLSYVAGLIDHAAAGSAFVAPTINAYKRYKPNSLPPDRAAWSRDNRGVMLRALGGAGDAGSRIENRAGDPAANPYLYLLSQLLAGIDGIDRALDPPPPTDTPTTTPTLRRCRRA